MAHTFPARGSSTIGNSTIKDASARGNKLDHEPSSTTTVSSEADMADANRETRPDFRRGIPLADLQDGGTLLGRVADEDVVLARTGQECFAIGAHCTHYHGPLAEGVVVGDTVRCPWHHACFSLRTGEPLRAPALDPVACWRVERERDMIFVREKLAAARKSSVTARAPASVVIVGGGAAGLAAADMLRRGGYGGPVTIISADDSPPCDRPNLSKDYLAGSAQDDWIPLRSPEYYTEQQIEMLLASPVSSIDVHRRQVLLQNGKARSFDTLLIATGADPVKLPVPGADGSRVHYLRSFADSRAIIEAARTAKRAVVVGAGFIGLEVAASLRTRGIDVDVAAPESAPMERVMGREVGEFIRRLHEAHGVSFHLGHTVTRIDDRVVTLSGGTKLDADVIVVGIGVRPATSFAETAGLAVDRGITVNEYLETSVRGIYAAGDAARWPDRHTGERIRVEHWVVAERQGQAAARNMLGHHERFDAVPFFWSQHYDITINYVGHAQEWDRVHIDGALDAHDCSVTYTRAGRTLAVATIGRDRESLRAEIAMERDAVDSGPQGSESLKSAH
jgi:NADPH-dependent 2,4-dienoyl-CoA reductase/sulfur reductase-like enzyme/nitrite reductase/ring-hydroxylating ferredoxin subunit